MKSIYFTTPLYYVNDKPHLGTAYSTTMIDVFNRYYKLLGYETLFLTGVDEHGQKLQESAQKAGLSPQDFCNGMAENFKTAWSELGISYDIFFRTTDDFHKQAVQKALQTIYDQGDIYANDYEGWYCVSEEIYYTEKELVDGKTPTGREVVRIKEKNYFFKMSKYIDRLREHIAKNPNFIRPESRKNEVLGFLNKEVHDLCISRPKSRLQWGIEIPFDRDYVTYVWFDALLNYGTAVGLLQEKRTEEFKKWWPQAHHSIGKDILTTHAVYWTTMLMALDVDLPKMIFAHGWILNQDNEKMSKSKGAVVDPVEFAKSVGLEGLRYFFCRDIHFGNDGSISQELIQNRLNADLANNLGNLLNRTTNLYEKFYGGKVERQWHDDPATLEIITQLEALPEQVNKEVLDFNLSGAIECVVRALNSVNRYLEDRAPWKQAKTDLLAASKSLYLAIEALRMTGILFSPIMPTKCRELLNRIGVTGDIKFADAGTFGLLNSVSVSKGEPLFPRFEDKFGDKKDKT